MLAKPEEGEEVFAAGWLLILFFCGCPRVDKTSTVGSEIQC